MSYCKAKMHQIRFRLGLCPRTRWGAYSAPPDSLAGFKGPTSKGGKGRARKGVPYFQFSLLATLTVSVNVHHRDNSDHVTTRRLVYCCSYQFPSMQTIGEDLIHVLDQLRSVCLSLCLYLSLAVSFSLSVHVCVCVLCSWSK